MSNKELLVQTFLCSCWHMEMKNRLKGCYDFQEISLPTQHESGPKEPVAMKLSLSPKIDEHETSMKAVQPPITTETARIIKEAHRQQKPGPLRTMDMSIPLNQCPDLLRFSQCLTITAMEHTQSYISHYSPYYWECSIYVNHCFKCILGQGQISCHLIFGSSADKKTYLNLMETLYYQIYEDDNGPFVGEVSDYCIITKYLQTCGLSLSRQTIVTEK